MNTVEPRRHFRIIRTSAFAIAAVAAVPLAIGWTFSLTLLAIVSLIVCASSAVVALIAVIAVEAARIAADTCTERFRGEAQAVVESVVAEMTARSDAEREQIAAALADLGLPSRHAVGENTRPVLRPVP